MFDKLRTKIRHRRNRLPKLCVKVDPYKQNVYIWEKGRKDKTMLFTDYDTQPLQDMMIEFYSEKCKEEQHTAKNREHAGITYIKVKHPTE